MNELPKDPMLLLSVVNTALRDEFTSLDSFCSAKGIDKNELTEKLGAIDYVYDPEQNRFL